MTPGATVLWKDASSCNFTAIQGASVGFSNKSLPLWLKCLTCTRTHSPSRTCTRTSHFSHPRVRMHGIYSVRRGCIPGVFLIQHLLCFLGLHFVTMARNADPFYARVRLQCHLVMDISEDGEEFHLVGCFVFRSTVAVTWGWKVRLNSAIRYSSAPERPTMSVYVYTPPHTHTAATTKHILLSLPAPSSKKMPEASKQAKTATSAVQVYSLAHNSTYHTTTIWIVIPPFTQ